MPASEIREILRYVPQFSGSTFVLSIQPESIEEACVAELVLDLSVAQKLGVQLLVALPEAFFEDFSEWFEENEMRFHAVKAAHIGDEMLSSAVEETFQRKQALLMGVEQGAMTEFLTRTCEQILPDKLIFITEDSGVRRNGAPIPAVNLYEAKELRGSQEISGQGWLKSAIDFCELGVPRVHVLEGNFPGVLMEELFSNQGIGTMVYRDEYRMIRSISEEDISEILAIIGRSVRSSSLIPRDFESIASNIEDYYVMTIDKHVMGCVALHEYPDHKMAEVACLFVRPEQAGRSYGRELVEYATQLAKEKDMEEVFALTKSAESFFQHELGFSQAEVNSVPESRRQILFESSRGSLVFSKKL